MMEAPKVRLYGAAINEIIRIGCVTDVGHGLPLRLRWQRRSCISERCRVWALLKSAESGQEPTTTLQETPS